VRRALEALSGVYVERRDRLARGADLDTAGKRAAFALFYGALHFATVAHVARELLGEANAPQRVVDLGCGTGVCSAAWALLHETPPFITGIDAHPWALDEARWNWRTLGLRGQATRGDLVAAARNLLKQSDAVLARTGVIAGWSINELAKPERAQLLEAIDQLLGRGVTLVILEPLARGVTPWWDEWVERLAPRGIVLGDVKTDTDLPAPLDSFSDAAGFRQKGLGARCLHR